MEIDETQEDHQGKQSDQQPKQNNLIPEQQEIEDEYEEEYIVVNLPQGFPSDRLVPGQLWQFKGLSSSTPALHLSTGEVLQGAYKESLGSQLVFCQEVCDYDVLKSKLVCTTSSILSFEQDTNVELYRRQFRQFKSKKVKKAPPAAQGAV